MITTINEFKQILENNNSDIINTFNNFLSKHNLVYKFDGFDGELLLNDIFCGELRFIVDKPTITVEMIYLEDNYRNTGLGYKIYECLLETAKKHYLDGIYSPAFDFSSGQQRSPYATRLLQKLYNQYGGYIDDITDDVDEDDIDDEMPFFGPPYLDITITTEKI